MIRLFKVVKTLQLLIKRNRNEN